MLYEQVMETLAKNKNLVQLIAWVVAACSDEEIPYPEDKLTGNWNEAVPGQKVRVVWTDPYRVEYGYLTVLPGFSEFDIYQCGIVHIPECFSDDNDKQSWYTLKHLAVFAAEIELLEEI